MKKKMVFKDKFAVIGKVGQGSADNSTNWINALWNEAGNQFSEIESIIRKDDICGAFWWGLMEGDGDDIKYLTGCEAALDALPPEGWTKWVIPAQTYVVAECTPAETSKVYSEMLNDPTVQNVGLGYECYSKPGVEDYVQVYVPIVND